MSGELRVRSNDGGHLRVWVVKPGDEWRAQIDVGDLKAEAKVYERYSREELQLDRYFADLANQWRGWDGEKEWEAFGLRLAARHDGLGHVTLDVTLEDDYATASRWRVRASLELDAGVLDRLAVQARTVDAA
jgi:Family of unknown function (DUF6228)